jgi:anaphase-promoting complex subunit 8
MSFSRHTGSKSQPPKPVNDVLSELLETLRDVTDPWLLFLYVCVISIIYGCSFPSHSKGLVLNRVGRREEAIEAGILSISGYPWNWSTWLMLISCIKDGEEACSP